MALSSRSSSVAREPERLLSNANISPPISDLGFESLASSAISFAALTVSLMSAFFRVDLTSIWATTPSMGISAHPGADHSSGAFRRSNKTISSWFRLIRLLSSVQLIMLPVINSICGGISGIRSCRTRSSRAVPFTPECSSAPRDSDSLFNPSTRTENSSVIMLLPIGRYSSLFTSWVPYGLLSITSPPRSAAPA